MGMEGIRREHRDAELILREVSAEGAGGAALARLAAHLEAHFRFEEEELIPLLGAHLPRSTGPLAVVIEEHRSIRALLDELVTRAGTDALRRLEDLLPSHFAKEEELIFPFAEARLSERELDRLERT